LAAGPVAETHFSGDATGALKGVPAAITHFATGSTEVGARLWHARSTDIRRADFIGSSAISAIDLAATAVIQASTIASGAHLRRALLANVGDAEPLAAARAAKITTRELPTASIRGGPAIEGSAGFFGARLANVGNAEPFATARAAKITAGQLAAATVREGTAIRPFCSAGGRNTRNTLIVGAG